MYLLCPNQRVCNLVKHIHLSVVYRLHLAMQLRQQFEAAGLNLTELQVLHGEAAE